ncbi:hypothetical protein ACLVWU_08440 [Bdellovibrio sp. HCB290]|uniref:hypothetical protein n=1 Tax=Bdellovibrio sp. HCB290 TaxID=3394356 RepID=UPI0039B59598
MKLIYCIPIVLFFSLNVDARCMETTESKLNGEFEVIGKDKTKASCVKSKVIDYSKLKFITIEAPGCLVTVKPLKTNDPKITQPITLYFHSKDCKVAAGDKLNLSLISKNAECCMQWEQSGAAPNTCKSVIDADKVERSQDRIISCSNRKIEWLVVVAPEK